MKFATAFSSIVAAFGLSVVSASASTTAVTAATATSRSISTASSLEEQHERLLVEDGFEDEDPWAVGTRVNYQWDGEWYLGTITNYFDGVYTIDWDEGETENFDDFDLIDQMVADFEALQTNDPEFLYGAGTPILEYFEEDDYWWPGVIVDIVNGQYEVQWEDGTVDVYPPGAEIDQAVADAANPPADANIGTDAPTEETTEESTEEGPMYDLQTPVYKNFGDDEGWWWGTITWYADGVYTITWSDDSTEAYDNLDEVTEMVQNAIEEEQPWPRGTAVWMDFGEEGQWYGEILTYYDGEYTIRWSDNSIDNFDEAIVDDMVADAADKIMQARAADSGRSAGGKFVLSLVIIGLIVSVTAFAMKYVIQKKGSAKKTLDEAAEEYRDDPDKVPEVTDLPEVI